MTGIEPASPAWKAGALPLSYIRDGDTIPASVRPSVFPGSPQGDQVRGEREATCHEPFSV